MVDGVEYSDGYLYNGCLVNNKGWRWLVSPTVPVTKMGMRLGFPGGKLLSGRDGQPNRKYSHPLCLLLPSSSSCRLPTFLFFFLFFHPLFHILSLGPVAMSSSPDGPSTSSHMMKTTKRGRPFLKVPSDLVVVPGALLTPIFS